MIRGAFLDNRISMIFLGKNAPVFGALIDLLVYVVLTALSISPLTAHVVAFLAGAVMYYGYSFSFREILKDEERWDVSQILYVIGFACMVLAIRGGIVFSGTHAVDLHPIVSFLPALLVTILSNLLYIRFVHAADEDSGKQLDFFLLAVGGFLVTLRFLYIGSLELIPEEAYYWLYAQHLSPGYLDHPPFVGWLISLGVKCFGLNEFGVRFFGWVATIGAACFLSLLHMRLFGKKGMFCTAVLASAIPYSFGAGFFISPDAGLFLFWSAALYFVHRALSMNEIFDWIFLGVVVGAGLLSKYSIALLALPTLFLMIIVPEWRRYFKQSGPYLAAGIAAVLFLPVIYWNATHEWASFGFQSTRRLNSTTQFSLHALLVDMMCLVTPSILAVIALLLFPAERAKYEKRSYLFAVSYFALPISIFVMYSLRHVPKLNWTGPSFLSMLPLVSMWLGDAFGLKDDSKIRKVIAHSFQPVFVIWMALAGLSLHYLGLGLPLVPYSQKMHRVLGWRSMTDAVLEVSNRVKAEVGEKPVLVGMDKHNIAAELLFYGTKSMGVDEMNLVGSRNIVGDEALMFRFWADPAQFVGKTIVLIAKDRGDLIDERVGPYFEKIGPIVELPLTTRGWSTKTYLYRVGYQYKGVGESQRISPENETPSPEPQFTPAPPQLNQS